MLLLLLLCGWLGASRLDGSAHVGRHALQVIQQRLCCRSMLRFLLLLLCGWLGASRLDGSAHVGRHALQVIKQRLRC